MNDEASFRRSWDGFAPSVWAYAARRLPRDEADDIVAETFLVAWRRRHDRPRRNEKAWLLSIAHNIIGTRYRSRERHQQLIARLESQRPDRATDKTDLTDAISQRLANALRDLPESELQALLLVGWDGLTPKDAATVAGCSRQALRMRLHRARRELERTLYDDLERQDQPT